MIGSVKNIGLALAAMAAAGADMKRADIAPPRNQHHFISPRSGFHRRCESIYQGIKAMRSPKPRRERDFREIVPKPCQADYKDSERPQKRRIHNYNQKKRKRAK